MKKFFALLLVLTICSLCFFVSCTNQNNGENNEQGSGDSGEAGSGENEIPDITDEEGDGILNEDNIDPNGWTKVD